jgi:hypothetical protein
MHMAERKDETKGKWRRAGPMSIPHKHSAKKRKRSTTKREVFKKCHKKRDKRDKRKRKKEGKKERGKAKKRRGKRKRKSAAPGLPAWSPTAVLPRLEPA